MSYYYVENKAIFKILQGLKADCCQEYYKFIYFEFILIEEDHCAPYFVTKARTPLVYVKNYLGIKSLGYFYLLIFTLQNG